MQAHMLQKKRPLLIIAGPTAVGKTAVSVELAKSLSGECVSADSVQVYRGLDIGSAKVRTEERQGIPHHLIDVLELSENYDALRFQQMAAKAIEEIYSRGHLPILVGGTGFYIQALLYGIDFTEEAEEEQKLLRKALERKAAAPDGAEKLYEELLQKDPEACRYIHRNNLVRIIRALEFYELHGFPISRHNQEERKKRPVYDACFFVLTDQRERLYRRINERADRMLAEGLLREAAFLKSLGLPENSTSLHGIGYREALMYLNRECTLEETGELIRKHSRNYAKRQLTWFRREREACWVDVSEFNYEKEKIAAWITEKCISHWE